MAFDIYGNNLRHGFCEIHPHVGEEYPCTICCMEREKQQQNKLEREEYNRIQKKEYEESLLKNEPEEIFDIDFGGNCMARMEIKNGKFKFTNAMNGGGYPIAIEDIKITPTN